ncbi:methyltransferase family protein [Prauserella shujinwangii]|uniref:Methyltransferase family protein n=1 Tax=Prauserella shujinwangii TaxID=1453103 RepID=A0A2T0M2X7_9PSEU|nr:methyltransferase domain-containing protein [Prauserella shujinwangii]PRX51098.1 methyltransferase family protein [Prauserella shujinwangii]
MSFAPEWLALREGADAEARSAELLEPLRRALRDRRLNRTPLVVRDLGCGTGSMGRWLSARLDGPQHWILHDHDPALLARAAAALAGPGRTTEPREGDLTALRADDLAGTDLVTASALLDLLTAKEVRSLAAACTAAGCPALLTLSVTGRVEFDPAEPLDAEFAAAFDEHQRRRTSGRRLLGPDAVPIATGAFEDLGGTVLTSPSPWWLGPRRPELTRWWLRDWVGTACEQRPELAPEAPAYLRRRLGAPFRVSVWHADLLALPGAP